MKNINNIIINAFVIFSIFICKSNYTYVGKSQLEVFCATINKSTILLADAAPNIGLNTAKELAPVIEKATRSVGVESAQIVADGVTNAAKIGAQSIDKLAVAGQIIGTVAGVGICVLAATQVVAVGKDLHSYLNPTDEEIDKQQRARESYEALHAKREFRKCIMQNHNHEKNESGRPAECEQLAKMFAAMNGKQALDEMTATFNSVYGK
ncbi:hypothetical protein HYX58_01900 [Candidatus Dependentiae bacterium]|nr:hypothetical protein [Candidatus Dependentiae bacterium]